MVECSVKTQLNGKSFVYRYGILVDDFEPGGPLVARNRVTSRTVKRGKRTNLTSFKGKTILISVAGCATKLYE